VTDPKAPTDDDESRAGDSLDKEQAEKDLKSAKRRSKIIGLIRTTVPKDGRNYAVAKVLNERFSATYDAPGVTPDGGKTGIVADFLASVDSLLAALGGDYWMRSLGFEKSVTIELEPVVQKAVRDEADRLAKQDPEGTVTAESLERLIPDSVVAAAAAARLLSLPSKAGLEQAKRYNAEVAAAYVRVAHAVDKSQGTLSVDAPGGQRAEFSKARARQVIKNSEQEEELPERRGIKISGVLTRTDSETGTFRVVLDQTKLPDIFDARRRVVEGGYTSTARKKVLDGSLWDHQVIATITAYPVREAMRAKPVYARFRFTNIEAAP
jgi:hypothetical protein